ncbi:hypothetical protein WISP_88695 [Willisornis vidua]|uniref:Uncharacterized protein n=1 Tax=Willisornis vidua TaxID=1566151 RepID=A0ABQ9D2A9_9PASS|nr:hypothetical protein WISP_88695 [Willisornis vidua]
MTREMENLSYEERLRELSSFSLEKKGIWGDIIVAFQHLKGACKKDGEGCITTACSDRTWGYGFKLKESRFRSDIRKNFFTVSVVRHWKRLPREAVNASSQEMFKDAGQTQSCLKDRQQLDYNGGGQKHQLRVQSLGLFVPVQMLSEQRKWEVTPPKNVPKVSFTDAEYLHVAQANLKTVFSFPQKARLEGVQKDTFSKTLPLENLLDKDIYFK